MLEGLPRHLLQPTQQRYHNPGFYFQSAASQAHLRKQHAVKTCIEPLQQSISAIFTEELKKTSDNVQTALLAELRMDDSSPENGGYYGQPILMKTPSMGAKLASQQLSIPESELLDVLRECLLVKHGEEVIQMLTKAYNQYKKIQTMKRMIYFIANNIAEEHLSGGEYKRANDFFDRIAKSYRKERWYQLLTSVLRNSLTCAKQLNLARDFISHSLDLISIKLQSSQSEREALLEDLNLYMNRDDNQHLDGLPAPLDSPLELEMDSKHVLLNLKVQFDQPCAPVHASVNFRCEFHCHSPSAMRFQKLIVRFSDSQYDLYVQDTSFESLFESSSTFVANQTCDLELHPNGKATLFTFPLTIYHVQDLQCLSVCLQLVGRTSPNQQVHFVWRLTDQNVEYLKTLKNYDHRYDIGQGNFVERPAVKVTQPESHAKIEFVHCPPSLINEHYPLRINLHSNQDLIVSGTCEVTCRNSSSTQIVLVDQTDSFITFGQIQPNQIHPLLVLIKSSQPGLTHIHVKIKYGTSLYNPPQTSAESPPLLEIESDLSVMVQFPFEAHYQLAGARLAGHVSNTFQIVPNYRVCYYQKIINNAVTNVVVSDTTSNGGSLTSSNHRSMAGGSGVLSKDGFPCDEPVVLISTLACNTPFPIVLTKAHLESVTKSEKDDQPEMICVSDDRLDLMKVQSQNPSSPVNQQGDSLVGTKSALDHKDDYSFVHVLRTPVRGGKARSGSLIINCRRGDPFRTLLQGLPADLVSVIQNCPEICYESPLPNVLVYETSVSLSLRIPSKAVVGLPLSACLVLENKSGSLQKVQLDVGDSEAFYFSGTTHVQLDLLPWSQKMLRYTLIPIVPGQVVFPRVTCSTLRDYSYVTLSDVEKWSVFVSPTVD
ncbi:hypothetical protein AKO1_010509 [Acrasis kona]|uniref:Trafficking protein particle complex subunit 11 n=1 Tax=Acrasis kona TaxID=1008807 RepID=A0AAW2ZJ85_9EUKA